MRQGDPISPKLFSSLLEDIFRNLNWNRKHGIKLDRHRLTNLRFADDVVLFAKNHKKLQNMLQDLSNCSKNAGLTMNTTKTQVMTNCQPIPIRVHMSDLQYVDEYIYLGQLVDFQHTMEKEFKRGIALA